MFHSTFYDEFAERLGINMSKWHYFKTMNVIMALSALSALQPESVKGKEVIKVLGVVE